MSSSDFCHDMPHDVPVQHHAQKMCKLWVQCDWYGLGTLRPPSASDYLDRAAICSTCSSNLPPKSANLAANESASESAARFAQLGGRDQNFGGWHKIKPIMRCSLCSYHSILHGTPQSVLHPKIWFFGNFAEFRRLVGPLADSGGGGGVAVEDQMNGPLHRLRAPIFCCASHVLSKTKGPLSNTTASPWMGTASKADI